MASEDYIVEIEPDSRLGIFRDRPCLRVTVTTKQPYNYVGSERTRRVDQDEARRLAGRMIATWEANYSSVSI